MTQLPKAYDPREVEPKWYRIWLEHDYFHADATAPKTPYSIAIPPPNVTGSLHIGHALGSTIQDILIRWRRMRAANAMWIPGTDHAGISTQIIVERVIRRDEGKSRHDLGRDEFIRRVWVWKEKYGNRISEQEKAMGFSVDWARERFTMDEAYSRSVRECFVRLHEEGLIYKARRLINWCGSCQTALSDLEVKVEDEKGTIWSIAYPVEGTDEKLIVATTRPETMLGDTAVAVHPDDERYKHLIGRHALLPLTDRRIPIIGDAILVDPAFGTGVVKVTPGHDFHDFETGLRHDLPQISILDLANRIIAPAPEKYRGLDVQAARQAVLADLAAAGLLVGEKPHVIPLGRCTRSSSVVEPLLSVQWFVKMATLAAPAIAAVEEGKVKLVPEGWQKTYMNWMRNIEDWCISRQLWWGHRIPAWTHRTTGELVVAREAPAGDDWEHDPDVLDTWFSSWLWPFATLGWPDKTRDLSTFYPTTVLVTGFDIIFFWVARMIMAGLHFTKKVPFRTVYFTPLIVDENGDKMSKSKGNGIDPLDVVYGATREELIQRAREQGAPDAAQKHIAKTFPDGIPAAGADALRFTLAALSGQGRSMRLSLARIEGYRHFGNKIWNAARFALMNLEGFDPDRFADTMREGKPPLSLPDRWILARLQHTVKDVDEALEAFRFHDAAQALYRFFWSELCDWYIELAKPALYESGPEGAGRRRLTQGTLAHALETALRLLHPFMPFLTEEIWQQLPKPSVAPGSVMITAFPGTEERFFDADAEKQMGLVVDVSTAIRSIRAEYNVPPSQFVDVSIRADGERRETLAGLLEMVERATRAKVKMVSSLSLGKNVAQAVVGGDVELVVPLAGLIDVAAEKARLDRDARKAEKEIETLSRKLGNASFVERAPAEVVDKERARLEEETARAARLRTALATLE
jgi:valyl-tRNA synthetase